MAQENMLQQAERESPVIDPGDEALFLVGERPGERTARQG
jgi:hypothetical protein